MFSPSNDALSGLAGGTGIGAVPGSNSLKPMQIRMLLWTWQRLSPELHPNAILWIRHFGGVLWTKNCTTIGRSVSLPPLSGAYDLKQELTSPPHKPALDEESFQQLLSAAHIIQEHNDKLLAKEPKAGSAETLAEIVETRKLVLTGEPDLRGAAGLIVARLLRITKSSGAAIGIYDQNQLVYLAGSGSAAGESGELVAVKSSLSGACLQTGKILRRADIATGPQLPLEFRRDSTVRSLIAVPIHRENRVAGVVELRFAGINGFSEDDVYACELMAALMTEALARADELDKKEALAAEREAMLQILEKIKPQLEKLAGEPVPDLSKIAAPAAAPPAPRNQTAKKLAASLEAAMTPVPPASVKPATTAGRICRGCGKEFLGDEAFCGKCGMTRSKPGGDNGHLQSKWASMWYMQQAAGQAEVKRESEKRDSGKRETNKREKDKSEADKRETAAKPETTHEAPANGNKSHGITAESKGPAVRSPWPTSPKPASPGKTGEVIPPQPAAHAEVSPETLAPKEAFVPRLPVSLEELVAQFAEESDLPLSAYPVVEAATSFEPLVEAEPVALPVPAPHEEALDWKLAHPAELEATAHAIPELSAAAELDEAETPVEVSDYADEPLVIRNPLGGDEPAEDEVRAAHSTALAKASPWTSAAHARKWLDSMRGNPRRLWLAEQWRRHHANIYLGAAAVIFAVALIGLFTQPAPAARKNPAEAQLTAFEKLMVDLGFAEAPPTPVNLGNPDRQVWVDLHTALYYCPGSDLYGKTAGGRYETQRSAQLDQFESAARRACD
jgi:putative methionine-R-sulfoxide reductase with GAF domain